MSHFIHLNGLWFSLQQLHRDPGQLEPIRVDENIPGLVHLSFGECFSCPYISDMNKWS